MGGRRASARTFALLLCLAALCCSARVSGQNVVSGLGRTEPVGPPVAVADEVAQRLVAHWPAFAPVGSELGRELAQRLEGEARALLDAWPLAPLVVELGISGEWAAFTRPEDTVLTLSWAYPYLQETTRKRVRALLAEQVKLLADASARYRVDQGSRREPYRLPGYVIARSKGRSDPQSPYALYCAWAYTCYVEPGARAEVWRAVRPRAERACEASFSFDPKQPDAAQVLNGYIAGLLGAARLARACGEESMARAATARLRELLQLRANFEKDNTVLVVSMRGAVGGAHAAKVSRYLDLVPELGLALRDLVPQAAEENVRTLERRFPVWYFAWGERLIGGENYINPPHFARAVFCAQAMVSRRSGEELARRLDVPWCVGDLWHMQKLALTLWALGGYRWT